MEEKEGEPEIVKKEGRKVGKEEKKQWLASCKAQKDILEREERSERERREKVKMGRRMSGVEFRIKIEESVKKGELVRRKNEDSETPEEREGRKKEKRQRTTREREQKKE